MSSELACRAVASARRETFRHRDGDDRLLTLPSPLSKRRGDISRGTAPLQPGCPTHLPRRYVSRGACFSPLHCEGRDNRAVHSATSKRRLVATSSQERKPSCHSARSRRRLVASLSQGLPRFAPKLFFVDPIGYEDYRIIGENRDGCVAKSFFAGKFGVSLFRSNE